MIKNGLGAIRYAGLEGSVSSASAVKTNLGYDVALANFESPLPIPSEIADVVVSLEIDEHIANAESFLLETNRILKPGGHLVLSTPNVGFLRSRLKYLCKAEVLQEGIHLLFLTGQNYEQSLPWLD